MSLGVFSKDKLVYDPTAVSDSDNVGVYLKDGTGNALTSTLYSGKQALDVKPLDNYAEDSAHVSGDIGSFILAVRNDANTSLVDTDGDYAPLQVTSLGRLKVDAIFDSTFDFIYAEDSPHTTGDLGAFTLLVRQDTLAASTSTDGDYGAFKSNDRGALWSVPVGTVADDAVDTENPVKIGSHAQAGPLTSVSAGDRANAISDLYRRIYVNNGSNIAILNTQQNVDNTIESAVPASTLPGRRTVMIQNLSSKEVYLGATGVSSGNGFVIAARATISLDLGPDVSVFVIGSTASAQDLRILELA